MDKHTFNDSDIIFMRDQCNTEPESDTDSMTEATSNKKPLLAPSSFGRRYTNGESVINPGESSGVNSRPETSGSSQFFLVTLTFFSAIGGFLFGYDTGVISGAMLLIKIDFNLTGDMLSQEVIVSSTIAAAAVFALVSSFLNSYFGRKKSIILASVVFVVGSVVLASAQALWMLIVGRIIVGIGIGIASMTVPLYIAEAAPAQVRGRVVSTNTVFIVLGQLASTLFDGAFANVASGWRYMLGLAAVPALVQLVGMLFMPESPRWLVSVGRQAEARRVLRRIRGADIDIDQELAEIIQNVEESESAGHMSAGSTIIGRILRTPTVRRALLVGCGLQFFQQLAGINTVMYYSASIIQMAGFTKPATAIWLSASTVAIAVVFVLTGLFLIEHIGRRPLTLLSLAGSSASLLLLGCGFQVAAVTTPAVYHPFQSNSSCTSTMTCYACTSRSDCGFCSIPDAHDAGLARNSSCLPTTAGDPAHSLWGACESDDPRPFVWSYNTCSFPQAWLIILALGMYLAFFQQGMSLTPWAVNAEIYPLWARSTGTGLSTAVNWLSNIFVSLTFLSLTQLITKQGTFWLYSGLSIVGFVFVLFLLPETRNRKLEEMEMVFSQPVKPCSCSGVDGTI